MNKETNKPTLLDDFIKNHPLPKNPNAQNIAGFVDDAFSIWNDLTPEELRRVVSYFKEMTQSLQEEK